MDSKLTIPRSGRGSTAQLEGMGQADEPLNCGGEVPRSGRACGRQSAVFKLQTED